MDTSRVSASSTYLVSILFERLPKREEEVKWFIKNFQNSLNVKLLITDGHAVELAKKLKRPVYYLTRVLRAKFLIEATPSVVFQPKGDVYMVVKTFVVPKK